MRRFVMCAAIVALVSGCGAFDDIFGTDLSGDSATNVDDGSSQNNNTIIVPITIYPPGGSPGASPTPGVIAGLVCQRDRCTPTDDCSAATCSWPAGTSGYLCARGHATIADVCDGPYSGAGTIDPGPPGNGGGAWQITVESAPTGGTVLYGPAPVSLDT